MSKINIFAPKEQQLEGLRFVLKHCTPQQFERSLSILVANKFMSKSNKHKLIKDMRHILGIGYKEYTIKYKK